MARIEAKLALTGLAAIAFAGCQMQGGVPRVDHRQVEPVVAPLAPTDSACDPYKWAPWTLENNGCPPEVLQTLKILYSRLLLHFPSPRNKDI